MHQQDDSHEHPLNQTTHSYVKASVEAALIVAYKQLMNGKTADP